MTEPTRHRPVRSFVLRHGRMTDAQQRAMEELWPRWGLQSEAGPLNAREAFGREAPLVLEIGFGMGHSLLQMATARPELDYLGIEVHRPGVGRLLLSLEEAGIDNVRVYCDDAVAVVRDCLPDRSLDGVQIFFPDPWHKKRHHKRRLIQPPFVELLCGKLRAGGFLHLATDWENYAEQMLDVLSARAELVNSAGEGCYSERPAHRPLTKFEQRGQKLGHGVWDLVFTRRSD